MVRVDADFVAEYPEADVSCTEVFATLLVVGDVLMALHEPRIEVTLGRSQTVAQALAVLDGAGEPLTPSQIGERLIVSSATMTSLLDTLEQRGWVRRTPNPEDRRSLLIEITDAGRDTADAFIPGLHKLERRVMSSLNETERSQLLDLLERVLAASERGDGRADRAAVRCPPPPAPPRLIQPAPTAHSKLNHNSREERVNKQVTPHHIMQVGMGFWASKTLLSAIELGLFTVLGHDALSAAELGERLGIHPRSGVDFLDALVSLGFLERTGSGPRGALREHG